jgi:hypothetical protein
MICLSLHHGGCPSDAFCHQAWAISGVDCNEVLSNDNERQLKIRKMEKNFRRVHTLNNIIITAVIAVAGIGLYFVNPGLGISLVVVAVLLFFLWKSGFRKDGLSTVFTKEAIDVPRSFRQNIIDFLEGKSDDVEFQEGCEGGCVRIEAFYNKHEQIAFAQLMDFSSYTYQPVGEMVELRGAKAAKFIETLAK